MIARFLRDETAGTAVEYGLVAAGVAVAIITVVTGLGSEFTTTFTGAKTGLK